MQKDVTVTSTVTFSAGIATLNLNGYSLTGANSLTVINLTGGALTVDDTAGNGKIIANIMNDYGSAAISITNSRLILEKGTVENLGTNGSVCILMNSYGIFDMYGGSLLTQQEYAIRVVNNTVICNLYGGSIEGKGRTALIFECDKLNLLVPAGKVSTITTSNGGYTPYGAIWHRTNNTYLDCEGTVICQNTGTGGYGVYVEPWPSSVTFTIKKGTLIASGPEGAFNKAPVISAGTSVTEYAGTDEASAVLVEAPISTTYTSNKYVKIVAVLTTLVTSATISGITAPAVGQTPSTSSICSDLGVGTVSDVTWTKADGSSFAGGYGFNTAYKASVTLTPAGGYAFADGINTSNVTVNGSTATSVTKNGNGTLTVTYTFPKTAKAKLQSIAVPNAVTGVANGTTLASIILPTTVTIVTENTSVTSANVAWVRTPANGSTYDTSILTEQTFTLNGTVSCPTEIDQNAIPLTTSISVTVSEADQVEAPTADVIEGTYTENQYVQLSSDTAGATIYYTTDGSIPTTSLSLYSSAIPVTGAAGNSVVTTIKAIAVKDTMRSSVVSSFEYTINKPFLYISSVEISGITAPVVGQTPSPSAICSDLGVGTVSNVTWTKSDESTFTGSYEFNTTYKASVTLTPASEYAFNTGIATSDVSVNGSTATSVTKNGNGTLTVTYTFPKTAKAKLQSIATPNAVTGVANGTTLASIILPTTVTIVTEDTSVASANVAWVRTPANGSTYDASILTEQTFTLNGTVTCPTEIDQNAIPLTTSISATVSEADQVEAPTADVTAGTYTVNQNVQLSSDTAGTTIYYTTDGSIPTTSSSLYSSAIPVTGAAGNSVVTTIKAIAVKDTMRSSVISSFAYTINKATSVTSSEITVTKDKKAEELANTKNTEKAVIDSKATVAKVDIDALTKLAISEKKTSKEAVDSAVASAKSAIDAATDTEGVTAARINGIHSIEGKVSDAIKDSLFEVLQAKASKTTNNSNTLTWKKISGADGYIIYGNRCGSKYKIRRITTVTKATTKYVHKKLIKGTYYKYRVVAYKLVDGKQKVISVSKTIHSATDGGKVGNAKSIKVNNSKVTLKLKQSFQIQAKEEKQSEKIIKHSDIVYQSTNSKIATVSAKGIIQAKEKGECSIYLYAQNGTCKEITLTVE